MDVRDILDSRPDYADGVASLCDWSMNYEHPTPFALFLDIIGWSDDEGIGPMFDMAKVSERFGYLEIGKLAEALTEYSDNPQDVREYVDRLMRADAGIEDEDDANDA